MSRKIEVVCETCGSAEVLLDAWAEWDVEQQDWTLHDTLTQGFCCACDGECHLIEREVIAA